MPVQANAIEDDGLNDKDDSRRNDGRVCVNQQVNIKFCALDVSEYDDRKSCQQVNRKQVTNGRAPKQDPYPGKQGKVDRVEPAEKYEAGRQRQDDNIAAGNACDAPFLVKFL